MCTLIIAVQVWQAVPLLVAANRDEQLARPSELPRAREVQGVRAFAPADLQAGGTWIGLNEHGVFAGITNRFGQGYHPHRRSRGMLVHEALRYTSADLTVTKLNGLTAGEYNPFHLVVGDRSGAHLLWSDGTHVRLERLAPGFHVVTERSLDAAPTQRIEFLREKVVGLFGPPVPEPEDWAAILRQRSDPPLEGINVYVPHRDYGTRSSTIVYLADELSASRYLHAEGPPDRVPYADLSGALRAMFAGSSG